MATRILDKGVMVYDDINYEMVVVISSNENKTIVRDENYNQYETDTNNLYTINNELTDKYGIIICDEHNHTENDYPYYIPIAQENAYEFELEHFSISFS